MKIIYLMSLIFSLSLVAQDQIVVGSFHVKNNAKNTKIALDNYIKTDKKLVKYMKKKSLVTNYKEFGEYYIVTVEPFNDLPSLFLVITNIKKEFTDAYALKMLEYSEPEIIEPVKTQEVPMSVEVKEEELAQQEQAPLIEEKTEETIETKTEIKMDREIVKSSAEKPANILDKYLVEIISIFVVLLLLIIFIMIKVSKNQRKPLQSFEFKDTVDNTTDDNIEDKFLEDYEDILDDNIHDLNTQKGITSCGGDESFYNEILDDFINKYSDSADRLKTYLEDDNIEEIISLLSDLDSITSNIGADTINEIVTKLKTFKEDSGESLDKLITDYEEHLKILLKLIETFKENR